VGLAGTMRNRAALLIDIRRYSGRIVTGRIHPLDGMQDEDDC
jgi:hypothetical protein